MSAASRVRWVVVVPVKALDAAKSRLAEVGDAQRRALAGAFAIDTVHAVTAVPAVRRVVVVCSDAQLVGRLDGPRVQVIDEPVPGGLNEAAARGIAQALAQHPGTAVAVLPADLPALRPEDLAAALGAASAYPRAVLADRDGTGTTLLTAMPGQTLVPRFGPGSHARHVAYGARSLTGHGRDRVARDVDTPTHLREARVLGVGPETGRLLDGD